MNEPSRISEASLGYRQKTVLVTGAGGYVGSRLVQALAAVDCRIIRLVCRDSPLALTGPCRAEITTVCGDGAIKATWSQIPGPWDCVFHLAAFEHRRGSPQDVVADLAINAGAMLHLLETCRIRGCSPQVVLASSSNLSGKTGVLPVDESTVDDPRTIYAIHKFAAEKYLQLYGRDFGIRGVTLRLANIFGPGATLDTARRVVLNRIIERAVLGGPLAVFNNQHCVRDYIFIDDIVRAFLDAGSRITSACRAHYILGSGEGITIGDAVRLVAVIAAAKIGRTVEVQLDSAASIHPVEWRDFAADWRQFNAATGWYPTVSLAEGIDRTIDFFIHQGFKIG
jgi:UDP-glucose 4-epimerase